MKRLLKPLRTWVIYITKALKCEVKGKSHQTGPDVLKVPSWATPAGPIWKLHKTPLSWFCFVFSYLKVPSIVVVERGEKLIWLGDVCNQLEFFQPKSETNRKLFYNKKGNREWKMTWHLIIQLIIQLDLNRGCFCDTWFAYPECFECNWGQIHLIAHIVLAPIITIVYSFAVHVHFFCTRKKNMVLSVSVSKKYILRWSLEYCNAIFKEASQRQFLKINVKGSKWKKTLVSLIESILVFKNKQEQKQVGLLKTLI